MPHELQKKITLKKPKIIEIHKIKDIQLLKIQVYPWNNTMPITYFHKVFRIIHIPNFLDKEPAMKLRTTTSKGIIFVLCTSINLLSRVSIQ